MKVHKPHQTEVEKISSLIFAVAEKEDTAPNGAAGENGAPGTNPLAPAGGPGGAFDFSGMSGLLEVRVRRKAL